MLVVSLSKEGHASAATQYNHISHHHYSCSVNLNLLLSAAAAVVLYEVLLLMHPAIGICRRLCSDALANECRMRAALLGLHYVYVDGHLYVVHEQSLHAHANTTRAAV
eukprot:15602-Heterococcus_DN1.PRE.5